jgi:hypothetical protein
MPGPGNGSKTEKYMWTQHIINEININVPVPSNIRGKDLEIVYDAKNILVKMKGQDPIIKGEFCKPIDVIK